MRCYTEADLLPPEAVFVAIDGARGAVEAMVEADTVTAGEATAIGGAHVALLTADGGFAALEAAGLACVEAATAAAPCDALLLELAALVDGGGVALCRGLSFNRSSLAEADGGSKCQKSDAKQGNFHGCISL